MIRTKFIPVDEGTLYLSERNENAVINFSTAKPDVVIDYLKATTQHHYNSHNSGHKAAANCSISYLACYGPHASPYMAAWADKDLQDFNDDIDLFNKQLDEREKRVKAFKAGKLPSTDAIYCKANSEEAKRQIADEIALLQEEASKAGDYFEKQKKRRAEGRAGSHACLPWVKRSYNFCYHTDIQQASVCAKVIGAIVEHFKDQQSLTEAEVVAFIKKAGRNGLRYGGDGSDDDNTGDGEDYDGLMIQAYGEEVQRAARQATSKGSFSLPASVHPQLLMALVLQDEDKGNIVTTFAPSDAELSRLAPLFEAGLPIAIKPEVACISTALALGEIVPEGRSTNISKDSTKAGEKYNEERVVLACSMPNGKTRFLVTARYVDAAPIIQVTPNSTLKFGSPEGIQLMPSAKMSSLTKKLKLRRNLSFLDLQVPVPVAPEDIAPGSGKYTWTVTNSALAKAVKPGAIEQIVWKDISPDTHRPLDIDGFKPGFSVTVSASALLSLYEAHLSIWEPKSTSGNKAATLLFARGSIIYQIEGGKNHMLECSDELHAAASLQFRPKDLQLILNKLLATKQAEFALSIDDAGMMSVAWQTQYAKYEIFLPTTTGEGLLEKRFGRPIR